MCASKQGFFSVLRWEIFVIVDKICFLEVWEGEKKKIILLTEVKKCFGFFFFLWCENLLSFFRKEKEIASLNLVTSFFNSLRLSICFVHKLAFFSCKQSFPILG